MSFRRKAGEWKARIKAEIADKFRNNNVSTVGSPAPSTPRTSSWVESEGWANLKELLNTLNQGAMLSGLGSVKSVIEGLVSCIQIYDSEAHGRKEYKNLRVELEDIFNELKKYLPLSPTITTSVINICGSIEKELEHVKARQTRSIDRRLVDAETEAKNVLECYRRIQSHLQRLSRNANISTWVIVDQIATDNRLRELAPSLWARYDSEKATELKRGPCTDGTRTSVLAQMREWATDRNNEGVYWINGMAGTGKTTIAYSLCQQLEMKEYRLLCASFFCSRSLPECRNVGRIIPSIAYQIADCSQPFRYALSKVMEENRDAHTRAPHAQFDSLIMRPFSDIKVREAFPTNMVVVIDALDECEDTKSTKQILEVLLTKSKGLPIRFVVSSRPEASIRHQMDKNGTWIDARVVLHELDTGEVQTDIKTYLRTELAPVMPSELEINKLAERAGVLFIYAATVIRYIGYDDFGRSPRARLNTILGQQSKAQTKEIDQLYGTILEAAMNDDELEALEREDMKLVLNTVVCAKSPLTVDGLNALLRLGDVERVKAALRPLWSVLHVIGMEMTVTMLHASFPDYLTDSTRSGGSAWHCSTGAYHHVLVQQCFECIRNNRTQFNICRLPSSYLNDDEVIDLDARVEKYIPVQLRYACLYWSAHLDASKFGSTFPLLNMLEQVLSRHLLLWLEVRNLTRTISTTPGELTAVKRWATRHGAGQELINLIQNVWRFALTIASSPISQSTPHIYVSMLPFLTSGSPIRKHYAERIHGTVTVGGTAFDRRKSLLARWPLKNSYCVACSHDGSLFGMVPYAEQDSISLIDVSSGQSIRHLSRTDVGKLSCLAFSPDGTRIASGTDDNLIWIWDVSNGQGALGPLAGHEQSVSCLAYSGDGSRIISGSYDNSVMIWNVRSGNPDCAPFVGHTSSISSIVISSDDTRIVSGSWDYTIRVWNMHTGCLALDPLTGHTNAVLCVAISSDDKFIISGSLDLSVRVWDSQTGQTLLGPFLHETFARSVAISPGSAYIIAGFLDGTIQIWDTATGTTACGKIKEHLHPVTMLEYSSDGTRIISYSPEHGSRLCLFDAQAATVAVNPLPGHTEPILSIDISPDGKHVVSGSEDMTLCVWDLFEGRLLLGPLILHTKILFVRYSSDGKRIMASFDDGTLLQWDAQTGDLLQMNNPIVHTPYASHSSYWRRCFASATYSPDGTRIATMSEGGIVCVWDSTTGEMVLELFYDQRREGMSVEYSSDGATLIAGWSGGGICVWDVQNGQLLSSVESLRDIALTASAFSSDRMHSVMASGFEGAVINQRATQTGELALESMKGHTNYISDVRYSHDGTRVVSGSWDRTLHVWDAQSGASIFGSLRGHTLWVNSVAYSPDDAYVASASHDTTIRIWNVSTQPNMSPPVEWILNEEGWVTDEQGRRLIWVPPDLRNSLMSSRNTLIISRDGYVRLSFDGAMIGDLWASCWKHN